jgi:hypothetical protein
LPPASTKAATNKALPRQKVQSERNVPDDAQSQYEMGKRCEHGENGELDFNGAIGWYRKAAQQGHAEAQYALASLLERASNTQNIIEIVEWFEKAAQQGLAQAQYRMGQACEMGLGVQRSASKAIEWYQQAAAQGNSDAALRALHLQAAAGDGAAQIELAFGHKSGRFGSESLTEVEHWLGKAADNRFSGFALHNASMQGDVRAEQLLEFVFSLANRGHADACYWLGIMHQDGRAVAPNNELAAKWYLKASDKNHSAARAALETLPVHVVEQVRRGRPKWDHRTTISG